MKTLSWKSLGTGRAALHLAHNGAGTWTTVPMHGHDFAELFVVLEGSGLHRVNGRRVPLVRGNLVLMRPGDRHGLEPDRAETLHIVNVAFPAAVLGDLGSRYFVHDPAFWGGKAILPLTLHLGAGRLEWFRGELEILSRAGPTRLALDRFLINLLAEISRFRGSLAGNVETLPEWLARACARVRQPGEALCDPRGFARLAGRSLEHVSRVLRQRTGRTPTEFLNEVRLDRAAALLANSGTDLLDIAAECGFQGISHFFASFRRRFGLTPRRYRLRHRRVFG